MNHDGFGFYLYLDNVLFRNKSLLGELIISCGLKRWRRNPFPTFTFLAAGLLHLAVHLLGEEDQDQVQGGEEEDKNAEKS